VTLVVDAGFVVAALVDDGPLGRWADGLLVSGPLAAPHLMPVEAANILRRGYDVLAIAGGSCADQLPRTTPATSPSPRVSMRRSPRSTSA